MKYWNSYHIFRDTYLRESYNDIIPLIEDYFSKKFYSPEVDALDTIINCSPGWEFKLRSSFSRKEKVIYFDIIIDYQYYMNLTNAARKEYIALSFLRDMDVLKKYKPKNFLFAEMKNDFKLFFQNIGWLLPD